MATLIQEPKKKDISYRYNLSEYLRFLKSYKWLFIGLMIISFLLEASHIVDKFFFKIIIDRGTEFVAGTLLSSVFVRILLVIGISFISLIVFKFIVHWLYIHMINHLESGLIVDLKRKYFNHIIHLSHSFHTSHKTGSLISRLTRGASAIERMTDNFIFNIFCCDPSGNRNNKMTFFHKAFENA